MNRSKLEWLIILIAVILLFCALAIGIYMGVQYGEKSADRRCQKIMSAKTAELKEIQSRLDRAMEQIAEGISRQTRNVLASWYGLPFHGRRAADTSIFSRFDLTVAHKTLPFGSVVYLENPKNGKWCFAKLTDRGPYWEKRELDVSEEVATILDMKADGVAVLRMRIL